MIIDLHEKEKGESKLKELVGIHKAKNEQRSICTRGLDLIYTKIVAFPIENEERVAAHSRLA